MQALCYSTLIVAVCFSFKTRPVFTKLFPQLLLGEEMNDIYGKLSRSEIVNDKLETQH